LVEFVADTATSRSARYLEHGSQTLKHRLVELAVDFDRHVPDVQRTARLEAMPLG
jgi:hypothetical protein